MVTELYDALREAGASEDKARKAAEVVASYDREFASIQLKLEHMGGQLRMLQWGQSITLAGVVAVLLKMFVP
jgi:hypothetical protein